MDKNSLEAQRRKTVLVKILIVVLGFIALIAVLSTIGMFASLVTIVIVCIIFSKYSKSAKKAINEEAQKILIPQVLSEKFNVNSFEAENHIKKFEISCSGMFTEIHSVEGSALLDASLGTIHFVRSGLYIDSKSEDTYFDHEQAMERTEVNYSTVFKGYVMRTEHSCPQFAGVNASDDDMSDIKRKGEKAASENKFSVYCGDNITSLPQNVIDGMMNVKNAVGRPAAMVFTDKYFYVYVSGKDNYFTINNLLSINANSEAMRKQAEETARIAETFRFLDYIR